MPAERRGPSPTAPDMAGDADFDTGYEVLVDGQRMVVVSGGNVALEMLAEILTEA